MYGGKKRRELCTHRERHRDIKWQKRTKIDDQAIKNLPDNNSGIKRSMLWYTHTHIYIFSSLKWPSMENNKNSSSNSTAPTTTMPTSASVSANEWKKERNTNNKSDNNTYDSTLLGNFYLLEWFLWLLMFDFVFIHVCVCVCYCTLYRFSRYSCVACMDWPFHSFYHFVFIIELRKWFNFRINSNFWKHQQSKVKFNLFASCHHSI